MLRGGGGSNATALDYVNQIRRRAYGNNSGDITAAQLTDSGQQVTLAHPLGPLSLHLSPREMRHVTPQGLRLSIDEGAALRLPDDRRIS